MSNFAFFEVPEEQANVLEDAVDGIVINGKRVVIERANVRENMAGEDEGRHFKKHREKSHRHAGTDSKKSRRKPSNKNR